jgi:hypothetical protein
MKRLYIVKSESIPTKEIPELHRTKNTFTDERKAKNFIDAMVGCCYDEGGKIEVKVIVE